MSVVSPPTVVWPPEVVEFARRHGVEDLLGPVAEGLARAFPTARAVRAGLEADRELRDEWLITLDIWVASADVPDPVVARRAWGDELARALPRPRPVVFGLMLHREP